MNPGLVSALLESLIRILPKDIVKRSIDAVLDIVENAVTKSTNQWDDAAVLPLCAALRAQIGVTEEVGSPYEDKKPDVQVNVTVKDGQASVDTVK